MIAEKLAELNITLPAAPRPIGAYVPAVRSGNMIFLSGQLPMVDGKLPVEYVGKLGDKVSLESGQGAACLAALNALAILQDIAGLDNIRRIVRLAGYVSSAPEFSQQPLVLNAASELFASIFGEQGKHARLALGAPVLPLDACIELELIVEVE